MVGGVFFCWGCDFFGGALGCIFRFIRTFFHSGLGLCIIMRYFLNTPPRLRIIIHTISPGRLVHIAQKVQ